MLIDYGARLAKIRHPWTKGQIERLNRTIRKAAARRFHHDDHDQLRNPLASFISAGSVGRRPKSLTPRAFIRKQGSIAPERFTPRAMRAVRGALDSGPIETIARTPGPKGRLDQSAAASTASARHVQPFLEILTAPGRFASWSFPE